MERLETRFKNFKIDIWRQSQNVDPARDLFHYSIYMKTHNGIDSHKPDLYDPHVWKFIQSEEDDEIAGDAFPFVMSIVTRMMRSIEKDRKLYKIKVEEC